MCGRFAFCSPHEAVTRLFGVASTVDVEPRWNIAPTQYIAAVRAGDGGRPALAMLYWGLVPWAADGLVARPVSRRVNDARNQGADLVEALGSPQDGA